MTAPARTGSGAVITCDGCSAPLVAPIDEARQRFAVGRPELYDVPEGEVVVFLVCPPAADGAHPCLTLARLDEELAPDAGPWCACGGCLRSWPQ